MPGQSTAQPPASGTAGVKFIAFESFKGQMNEFARVIQARAYERYERRGREDGHALDDWISAESEMRCLVPVGILESPEQLEVHVRLLGCLSNEIEVGLEPSCLCIRVQKETEGIEPTGEGSTKQLLNGIFVAINLPAHVDPAKVTSAFKDGDLCLSLSRAFA